MIGFSHSKCVKCGLCLGECLGGILEKDADGFPVLNRKNARYCIGCGHCFAVCPKGAVIFRGRTADEAKDAGALPQPEEMANLLRQRRSVRKYKPEAISAEKMANLKTILNWMPTGCNDHRLVFSIVEDREVMEAIRAKVSARLKILVKTGILRLVFPPSKRYLEPILNGEDVIFRGAPHLIAASTPVFAPCSTWDAKIALAYFDTYAQSLGLGTCWCGFGVWAFRMIPSLRKMLKQPHFYRLDAMMLFGEPAVSYPRATVPEPFKINIIQKKNG